jgi:Na+-transporting methylmalonyl-CoA/oxaloacetate decarboxylase gamma subunit
VGLLALIIAGYGLSQIVRSFIPNAVAARHALDRAAWEEEQSEEFQLRDEDQP